MKKIYSLTWMVILSAYSGFGQGIQEVQDGKIPALKVISRSYGPIIGIQKGQFTYLELGAEYHWKKIKLVNPRVLSVGGNFEYNFRYHVAGYKLNIWSKRGRVDLTYGIGPCYFTDFTHHRIGVTPNLGFRLLGFHLLTGYNFTFGSENLEGFNDLFLSLRYFFPSENKIKFKRKNKKK